MSDPYAPTPTTDDTLAYVGVPVTSFTLEPIEPTGRQERAVLNALFAGKAMGLGLCGTRTTFFTSRLGIGQQITVRRLAARINDLRKKGWKIETVRWCDQHEHPESKQIMYRLVK